MHGFSVEQRWERIEENCDSIDGESFEKAHLWHDWISLDMPFGTILRSFEWCHEKRSIVRAIFQEKPKKALMTSLARAGGNEGDSRCRQERL
jgi:hypothetical protein